MYFYSAKLPLAGEIVFGMAKNITENGAYISLVEYDDVEGFISLREFDWEKNKGICPKKQLKSNTLYPFHVMDVETNRERVEGDTEKIFIGLSIKKVSKDIRSILLEKFDYVEKIRKFIFDVVNFAKMEKIFDILGGNSFEQQIYSILPKILSGSETDIHPHKINLDKSQQLYESILSNVDIVLNLILQLDIGIGTDIDLVKLFKKDVLKRITKTPFISKQMFTCMVLEKNGIDSLRKLLVYQPETAKSKNETIELECISSPKYQLLITCDSIDRAKIIISDFVTEMRNRIGEYKCMFELDGDIVIVKDSVCSFNPIKKYHIQNGKTPNVSVDVVDENSADT